MRTLLLISISALVGALAFIASIFWWTIVVFLIPLFYTARHFNVSYLHGLWWGFIFWSFHLSALLLLIIRESDAGWLISSSIWLVLVGYGALYAGLWFACAITITRLTRAWWISWLCATWLYFFIVDRAILWIFDVVEGYELAHPVLPLVRYTPILFLIPWLGKQGLLFFLIVFQLSIVELIHALQYNKPVMLLMVVISLMPFLISWLPARRTINRPEWLDRIVCMHVMPDPKRSMWQQAHMIRKALEQACRTRPDLIVMPESTFPFCLNEHQEILKYWHEYALPSTTELILGGHRREGNDVYNTLYFIRGDTIVELYDKQHGLLFVERVPHLFDYPALRKFFLSDSAPFCQSTKKSSSLQTSRFKCAPLICSELFFSHHDTHKELDLYVALVNDTWYCAYQRFLMRQDARLKALLWQKDILYVSYSEAALFARTGVIFLLPTVNELISKFAIA